MPYERGDPAYELPLREGGREPCDLTNILTLFFVTWLLTLTGDIAEFLKKKKFVARR